jgi:hypothetical protein
VQSLWWGTLPSVQPAAHTQRLQQQGPHVIAYGVSFSPKLKFGMEVDLEVDWEVDKEKCEVVPQQPPTHPIV